MSKYMTDPIADMLTRIRNSIMVKKEEVTMPFSNIKFEIGKILEREGFIARLEKLDNADHTKGALRVVLKYKNNEPAIRGLKRVSTPGQRIYQNYRTIPKVLPSLGILIVSTSDGLMTNKEAKQKHIGGEVLCEVY